VWLHILGPSISTPTWSYRTYANIGCMQPDVTYEHDQVTLFAVEIDKPETTQICEWITAAQINTNEFQTWWLEYKSQSTAIPPSTCPISSDLRSLAGYLNGRKQVTKEHIWYGFIYIKVEAVKSKQYID
jgi:hypothetical protein